MGFKANFMDQEKSARLFYTPVIKITMATRHRATGERRGGGERISVLMNYTEPQFSIVEISKLQFPWFSDILHFHIHLIYTLLLLFIYMEILKLIYIYLD
jgi:hypothetical protein